MMNQITRNSRTIFGGLLILAGVLILLQQLGYIGGGAGDAIFTGLFALGALHFYGRYREDPESWWLAMIAFVLAAFAVEGLLDLFLPAVGRAIGGALFFIFLGTAFLIAFLRNNLHWWAVIPAGVMYSLAAVTVVDDVFRGLPIESGGILFLGIGLTFLALTFIRVNDERMSWGIFPAVFMIAFGLYVSFGEQAAWNVIWPSILILVGGYFLVDALIKRN
jgi:hypothetical protein